MPSQGSRFACRARSGVAEDAIALLVNDLLRLGDREADRVILARVRIDADKAVLFHAVGEFLGDHARGVPARRLALRRRRDPIALVFDRARGGSRLAGCTAASKQVAQRIHQAHARLRSVHWRAILATRAETLPATDMGRMPSHPTGMALVCLAARRPGTAVREEAFYGT